VPAPNVAHKDNGGLLPSVPNHIPNPWPTTNPSEREELLKLIAEFSGPFIPVPPHHPVSPINVSKPLEKPTATPPRNNPFLTPPSTAVVLPQAITPPLVERRPAFESRPWADDPLPSWASLTPDVSGLMHENATEPKPASIVSEPTSVVGSPLSGEALLNRPASSGLGSSSSYPRSLAELIHQLPALVPSKNPDLEALPEARQALIAIFVEDVTVPDGQAFPPGAEFVKCWRLRNTSNRDWPENTELVFLAGDSLSDSALPPVLIGQVAAGAEFDVWTGELKAPDTPGRYVGYWRMKADGELFGNSLWIEINVVESDSHHSSDDAMAASSIIMPDASSSAQRSEHVPSTTVHSLSATSTIVTEDNVSDIGSDSSSVSLISMPSSPSDDEDEALFHDSRSQTMAERASALPAAPTAATSGMDYVMLYDDNSSSEE
jgi:next-to-BRCA1 protein 1